jgi:hypothetical protein
MIIIFVGIFLFILFLFLLIKKISINLDQLQTSKILKKYFPRSIDNIKLTEKIIYTLQRYNIDPTNTIYSDSICSDEINHEFNDLTTMLDRYFGSTFILGGLAGYPFTEITGFNEFAHHVPDDGNLFILFAPHIGISNTGKLGEYNRKHQNKESTCCGALIGAYNTLNPHIESVVTNDHQLLSIIDDIKPLYDEVSKDKEPMLILVKKYYDIIEKEIEKIINLHFGDKNSKLILLGGIIINTPDTDMNDYFLPYRFEIRQNNRTPVNLLSDIISY